MSEFWKPKPTEPLKDWRMYALLVPTLASAFGFFMTGVFAFAFSDIEVIPDKFQSWLVICGSALIVLGAELNTPFVFIEVFRRMFNGEYKVLDITALVSSLIGTGANLLVAEASRMQGPVWQELALTWGPILGGLAVVLDYYGAGVEIGFVFGTYEERYEKWLNEKKAFLENNGSKETVEQMKAKLIAAGRTIKEMRTELQKRDRPVCNKKSFMKEARRAEGPIDRERALTMIDKEMNMRAPHSATLARWLGELSQ